MTHSPSTQNAELAARIVVYYVLGFTADERSRLQWDAAGAELASEQSVLSEDPGARFRFGVDLLVNGLGVSQLRRSRWKIAISAPIAWRPQW